MPIWYRLRLDQNQRKIIFNFSKTFISRKIIFRKTQKSFCSYKKKVLRMDLPNKVRVFSVRQFLQKNDPQKQIRQETDPPDHCPNIFVPEHLGSDFRSSILLPAAVCSGTGRLSGSVQFGVLRSSSLSPSSPQCRYRSEPKKMNR